MSSSIPERDWKYLRKIQPDMLDTLCQQINQRTERILKSPDKSDHEKYLAVYDHIKKSDRVVAKCFSDWRRSNIWLTIPLLYKEGLLTEDHLKNMTEETSQLVDRIREFNKE
jgi:hypothetical protein